VTVRGVYKITHFPLVGAAVLKVRGLAKNLDPPPTSPRPREFRANVHAAVSRAAAEAAHNLSISGRRFGSRIPRS